MNARRFDEVVLRLRLDAKAAGALAQLCAGGADPVATVVEAICDFTGVPGTSWPAAMTALTRLARSHGDAIADAVGDAIVLHADAQAGAAPEHDPVAFNRDLAAVGAAMREGAP